MKRRARAFVNCGQPLPEYEMEIRDEHGRALPDRRTGTIFVRGPSVMSGYFNAPQGGGALGADGWLNTGDIGYSVDGSLVITGRQKDLIIINGRNIWPQDWNILPSTRTRRASAMPSPSRCPAPEAARSACSWCSAVNRTPIAAPP